MIWTHKNYYMFAILNGKKAIIILSFSHARSLRSISLMTKLVREHFSDSTLRFRYTFPGNHWIQKYPKILTKLCNQIRKVKIFLVHVNSTKIKWKKLKKLINCIFNIKKNIKNYDISRVYTYFWLKI